MRDDGFSLLEVVVALAVLSASVLVFYQGVGSALQRQSLANERMQNLAIATSIMEGIGATIPVNQGITEGRSETGIPWVLSVDVQDPSQDRFAIQPIDINVVVGGNGSPSAVNLSTRRLVIDGRLQ